MAINSISLFLYFLVLSLAVYFDHQSFRIPDWLTLPAILFFLGFCIFRRVEWTDILLRVVCTGGMFYMAGLVTSFVLKKETLGGGDIKLITAVGIYSGWQEGLTVVLLSAVSALVSVLVLSVWKKRKLSERIPFGFFIGICGIFYKLVELSSGTFLQK